MLLHPEPIYLILTQKLHSERQNYYIKKANAKNQIICDPGQQKEEHKCMKEWQAEDLLADCVPEWSRNQEKLSVKGSKVTRISASCSSTHSHFDKLYIIITKISLLNIWVSDADFSYNDTYNVY